VLYTIEQERGDLRCSACGSHRVTAHGGETRIFRLVPIGRKPVHWLFRMPRVECHDCQLIRQGAVPFADPRRRYTHAFERYALELAQHMTIQDVAQHLHVGWDTIKDMQKRDLQRHFAKPKLKHLRRIAMDEIAIGKGQRY
jgi:transposase